MVLRPTVRKARNTGVKGGQEKVKGLPQGFTPPTLSPKPVRTAVAVMNQELWVKPKIVTTTP